MIHFEKNDKGEWVHQVNSKYEGRLSFGRGIGIFVQVQHLVDALPREGEHALALTFSDWRAMARSLQWIINGHEAVGMTLDHPDHQWIGDRQAALSHWLGSGIQYLAAFSGRYELIIFESADTGIDPDSEVPGDGLPRLYQAVIKR